MPTAVTVKRAKRRDAANELLSTYVALSPDVLVQWRPSGITRSVMISDQLRVDYGPDGDIVGVLLVDFDNPTVRQYRRNWPGSGVPTQRRTIRPAPLRDPSADAAPSVNHADGAPHAW